MRSESVESRTHPKLQPFCLSTFATTRPSEKPLFHRRCAALRRFHTTTAQVIEGFGGYAVQDFRDAQMVALESPRAS